MFLFIVNFKGIPSILMFLNFYVAQQNSKNIAIETHKLIDLFALRVTDLNIEVHITYLKIRNILSIRISNEY